MANGRFIGREEALRRIRLIPRAMASKKIVLVKPAEKVEERGESVGMKVEEKRLADFLGAVQDVKPIIEKVEAGKEEEATEVKAEVIPEVVPEEQPVVEREVVVEAQHMDKISIDEPKRKRRGRKGKKKNLEG